MSVLGEEFMSAIPEHELAALRTVWIRQNARNGPNHETIRN